MLSRIGFALIGVGREDSQRNRWRTHLWKKSRDPLIHTTYRNSEKQNAVNVVVNSSKNCSQNSQRVNAQSLHSTYLGEMTTKEIGRFLGVSVDTIKSRLRRGRKRLQEDEELMIQEVFGGVQIPASLGENVMRQVADMAPTPSPAAKPFLPWMALGTVAVLIALLLGASNRYLTRFQKPYSFDAQSEPTIEIVEAPIILDIVAKPAVRNQVGRDTSPGKTSRAGTQVSNLTSASVASENATKFSTAQWMPGNGPPAGPVRNVFATSDGTVYAVIQTGIYRLTADATAWTRVDASIPIGESLIPMALMPMAEHSGRLYIVSTDEIFASDNRGETWRTLGPRPKGAAVELVITSVKEASSSQAPITMYLALRDRGIFRFHRWWRAMESS